jgi:hypothetical protein
MLRRIKMRSLVAVVALATLCMGESAQEAPKPLLRGLMSMGSIDFHRRDGGVPDNSLKDVLAAPGVFDGVAINVTWAQLQPTPGGISTSAIDEALERVRSYNQQHPATPLAARLRVWAGPNAPDWVKRIGGSPITVLHRDIPITIGSFWSEEYRRAWRALQTELARKYDKDPLVRDVSMSSCSSVSVEPFVLPGDPVSLRNLQTAGFSDQKYRECLAGAAADYASWHNSSIEFPFNPFRDTDSGGPRQDMAFTLATMRAWRERLRARAILSNDSLQSPPIAWIAPIYAEMKELGPPLELQLNAPKGINLDDTMAYGIGLGATTIEIWPVTSQTVAAEKLSRWSAELKRDRAP